MSFDKILYTAKAHTTGGRDGGASPDRRRPARRQAVVARHWRGRHEPRTAVRRRLVGGFLSAVKLVAGKKKIPLPADVAIDAEVDLGVTRGVFGLAARLNVSLPGVDPETARALVDAAHQVCPYSHATRGNIDVAIAVVTR